MILDCETPFSGLPLTGRPTRARLRATRSPSPSRPAFGIGRAAARHRVTFRRDLRLLAPPLELPERPALDQDRCGRRGGRTPRAAASTGRRHVSATTTGGGDAASRRQFASRIHLYAAPAGRASRQAAPADEPQRSAVEIGVRASEPAVAARSSRRSSPGPSLSPRSSPETPDTARAPPSYRSTRTPQAPRQPVAEEPDEEPAPAEEPEPEPELRRVAASDVDDGRGRAPRRPSPRRPAQGGPLRAPSEVEVGPEAEERARRSRRLSGRRSSA